MSLTEQAETCGACEHWYVDIQAGWLGQRNGQRGVGAMMGQCGVFKRDGIYQQKKGDQACNAYDGVADRLFELAPEDE